MTCTWCGSVEHEPFKHGALVRRPDWETQRFPFFEPSSLLDRVLITLTPDEIAIAKHHAALVLELDHKAGWHMQFHTGNETELQVKERGYGAEIAASRATGLRWHNRLLDPKTYRRRNKRHDLGKRTEVRNALYADGRLWSRANDKLEWCYVLVTGKLPTFVIVGWLEAVDLWTLEHWSKSSRQGAPDAYAAYQDELHPLPLPDDA